MEKYQQGSNNKIQREKHGTFYKAQQAFPKGVCVVIN